MSHVDGEIYSVLILTRDEIGAGAAVVAEYLQNGGSEADKNCWIEKSPPPPIPYVGTPFFLKVSFSI